MPRVYVGNISYNASKESLLKSFENWGKIVSFDMPERKGFAFVEYEDQRDAEDAIAHMNNQDIDGRAIKVELATSDRGAVPPASRNSMDSKENGQDKIPAAGPPSGGKPGSTGSTKMPTRHIYVAGIPPTVQADGLKRHFDRFGEVENVTMLPIKKSGDKSAFVDFRDLKSAEDAFYNGRELEGGAVLRLDFNQPKGRPRASGAQPHQSASRRDMPREEAGFGARDRAGRSRERGYERGPPSDSRDYDRYNGRDRDFRSPPPPSTRGGYYPERREDDYRRGYDDRGMEAGRGRSRSRSRDRAGGGRSRDYDRRDGDRGYDNPPGRPYDRDYPPPSRRDYPDDARRPAYRDDPPPPSTGRYREYDRPSRSSYPEPARGEAPRGAAWKDDRRDPPPRAHPDYPATRDSYRNDNYRRPEASRRSPPRRDVYRQDAGAMPPRDVPVRASPPRRWARSRSRSPPRQGPPGALPPMRPRGRSRSPFR